MAAEAFKPGRSASSAFHVLVLDDVGTKVDRTLLRDVTPTWELETSPGNSQVGFVFNEPLRDMKAVERLGGGYGCQSL